MFIIYSHTYTFTFDVIKGAFNVTYQPLATFLSVVLTFHTITTAFVGATIIDLAVDPNAGMIYGTLDTALGKGAVWSVKPNGSSLKILYQGATIVPPLYLTLGFIDDSIYAVTSDPEGTVYQMHESGIGLSYLVESEFPAGLMATAIDVVSPNTFITHSPMNGDAADIYFDFSGQDQGIAIQSCVYLELIASVLWREYVIVWHICL